MALVGALQTMLGRNTWPPAAYVDYWETLELYGALRDTREDVLRGYHEHFEARRALVHAPVARMISRASANLLFGRAPNIDAAVESDAKRLEFLVDENGLDAELHRAAIVASSEGGVWGRIKVDPALLDAPIVEFESPRCVLPYFEGRFVAGATFIEEEEDGNTVYRRFETYGPGFVETRLFRGTRTRLGEEQSLTAHPITDGRDAMVATGFDRPLVAFVPNSIDSRVDRGVSDYHGLVRRLFGITEASTVGVENLRLAGQQRALVDERWISPKSGTLPARDNVLVVSKDDVNAGEPASDLQMLEYAFDAAALIAYTEHLIDTTLQFAGIAPEIVGRNATGGPVSGTALRMRMIHSLMENAGKGRYFDRGVRRLLRMAAVIDSRRTTEGGFGRRWSSPDSDPTIERADSIPPDDDEAARILVALTNAEAISLEEKVAYFHPDWTERKVAEEVQRIKDEQTAPPSGLGVTGIANPLAHPAMAAARDAAVAAAMPGGSDTPAGDRTPAPARQTPPRAGG